MGRSLLLLGLQWSALVAAQSSIVYVDNLPDYTLLAPCAKSALSYGVASLTYSKCSADVTALESCACTKDGNSVALAASLTSSIRYYCGSTASADLTSASLVLSHYCNQQVPYTSPPAPNTITQYINEFSQYQYLAPCAKSAITDAINYLTQSACPSAPADLASCACLKPQISLFASGKLDSSVRYSCGSTASEDRTSAQSLFAAYCGLITGVSSFPTVSQLPGSLTYFITDLPQYNSLANCAQNGVNQAVMHLTYSACPNDPGLFASCACVKDMNSQSVTAQITSSVRVYCDSTASSDVSSAIDVFALYCNVAKALSVVTGVTATATSPLAGSTSTGAPASASAGLTAPTAGATGGPGNTIIFGGSSSSSNATATAEASTNVGLIAGVVGGVAGGLILIGIIVVVALLMRRRRRRQDNYLPPPPGYEANGRDTNVGKSELPGGGASVRTQGVSPSVHSAVPASPSIHTSNGVAEMPGMASGVGGRSEMAGRGPASPASYHSNLLTPDGRPEMMGVGGGVGGRSEMASPGVSPGSRALSPGALSEVSGVTGSGGGQYQRQGGQGWQSGPVQDSYHEGPYEMPSDRDRHY